MTLRTALLALLVLAALAPAPAAASVDACEKYYVCHRVVVQPDPLRACGAVGLGYQGVGACAFEDPSTGALCVSYVVGYSMRLVCAAMA